MKKKNKKNRKWLKKLGIGFGVLTFLVAATAIFFVTNPVQLARLVARDAAEDRAQWVKSDDELLGTRFTVPREGIDDVETILYRPEGSEDKKLPVIFMVHGGGFFGGAADMLDTFNARVMEKWQAMIVSINYKKLDEKFIPYPAEEIRDTIYYFAAHEDEYNIDSSKFATMGFSAGSYHVANTSLLLQSENFKLAGQVLVVPYLMSVIPVLTPNLMDEEIPTDAQVPLASTVFVLGGQDEISNSAKPYIDILNKAGVPTQVFSYEKAFHPFMDTSEVMKPQNDEELKYTTEEQKQLGLQAEDDLIEVFHSFFSNSN
ncbi:alpha/beta hydrolase [Paenibacillus sp. E222]|uniref:alpha/beta hydrolase n=1 Tax=Paenibacillus sp. E222 TaxID=2748863 RepID=UPI0015C60BD5|nr:alpha/beta hydrolase [Paenibacillus sp. E222]QLG40523.1 alpha/beta hydrolase [Paenibacillus sp. E222]